MGVTNLVATEVAADVLRHKFWCFNRGLLVSRHEPLDQDRARLVSR